MEFLIIFLIAGVALTGFFCVIKSVFRDAQEQKALSTLAQELLKKKVD